MIGRTASQHPDKFGHCRTGLEKVEMRPTAAIGSAEAKRRRSSAKRVCRLGPQTFPAAQIDAGPDRLNRGVLAQIIDMPVRADRHPAMVAQAAREAAGTERAADVERPARCQRQRPLADEDCSRIGQPQQQGVGSRLPRDRLPVVHRLNRLARCGSFLSQPSGIAGAARLGLKDRLLIKFIEIN